MPRPWGHVQVVDATVDGFPPVYFNLMSDHVIAGAKRNRTGAIN
jgi:hypothetical protein